MAVALALAAAAAGLPTGLAFGQTPDGVRIEGRGFGHGVGMSQYGAYGFALREGRTFQEILHHYYAGTAIVARPRYRLRVLVQEREAVRLAGVRSVRDGAGRRVRLNKRRRYQLRRAGRRVVIVTDGRTGKRVGRWRTPLRLLPARAICLDQAGSAAPPRRCYRGSLTVMAPTPHLQVINVVDVEEYLYGVVPSEMLASWPIEALKAQAVAARSYALRRIRPQEAFDLYADTRSQEYGGMTAETPSTNRAVDGTRGLIVAHGGAIADALFFSTSGGRTAASEEVFATAVDYLRSVEDPHDDLSPYHAWGARFTAEELERRLGARLRGDFRSLAVVEGTPSGRVARVRLVGSGGSIDLSGAELRTALGLRSTWFSISER